MFGQLIERSLKGYKTRYLRKYYCLSTRAIVLKMIIRIKKAINSYKESKIIAIWKGEVMIRKKDIIHEIRFLEKSIQNVTFELEKIKNTIPEDIKLRVIRHGNVYQYFYRKKGMETNGTYIKKDKMQLAKTLAQIEYDEKLIMVLQEALESLNKCKEIWMDSPFVYTLNQIAPGKRVLVDQRYSTDENYIINWINQDYERLGFREGYPEYFTRKGLRMRSKSEVMIADYLDEMNIPFLYEKPLQLGNTTVHPDFTLMNIKERKELYWEHFGMMDDIEYRNNAFNKIRKYEFNDLYIFDSVIWTFESSNYPLNIKEIRKMIVRLKDILVY